MIVLACSFIYFFPFEYYFQILKNHEFLVLNHFIHIKVYFGVSQVIKGFCLFESYREDI